MMIKAVNDRLAVKMPEAIAQENERHIITLLKSSDKVVCSEVVAVGEGTVDSKGKFLPMEYSVGDIVYYPVECSRTCPSIKDEDGKQYLFISQAQVLCYRPAKSI